MSAAVRQVADETAAEDDLVGRLHELLDASLALWGVDGFVRRGRRKVTIERGRSKLTVRFESGNPVAVWWIGHPGQSRPCASILDVLRAVRKAV